MDVHNGSPQPSPQSFGTVPASVRRITLRPCRELVGEFHGIERDGRELRVTVHDRLIAYPVGSDEANALEDSLNGVPEGTLVGVLCLLVDERPKIFVRVEGAGEESTTGGDAAP